jgi:hypothetical protein
MQSHREHRRLRCFFQSPVGVAGESDGQSTLKWSSENTDNGAAYNFGTDRPHPFFSMINYSATKPVKVGLASVPCLLKQSSFPPLINRSRLTY